nr:MAG: nucleoprotein [Niukluk phantom virus]
MSSKWVSVQQALVSEGIDSDTHRTKVVEAMVAAESAASIAGHLIEKDYLMYAMSPQEVYDAHGSTSFDSRDLLAQFVLANPDYAYDIRIDAKTQSMNFMSKMLFEIGPETRSVKVGVGSDKLWRLRFVNKYTNADIANIQKQRMIYLDKEPKTPDSDGTLRDMTVKELVSSFIAEAGGEKHCTKYENGLYTTSIVNILTYKNTVAPQSKPKFMNGVLNLTIKQASYVALTKLEAFTKIWDADKTAILTPLAGATFNRDDIHNIMKEPAVRSKGLDRTSIINAINSSSQSGGQYVNGSRADVAAVCVLSSTKAIKDKAMRMSIVTKTIKQFYNIGKVFEVDVFKAFSMYATCGLPAEMSPEKLLEEFDMVGLTQAEMRRTARETETKFKGLGSGVSNESGEASGSGTAKN